MGEVGTLSDVSRQQYFTNTNTNANANANANTGTSESANQQNATSSLNSVIAAIVENSQANNQKDTNKNADSAQKTNENAQLKDLSKDDVKKVIDELNKSLEKARTNLRFNYHEEAGMFSVAVVDQETNEVIKELPPEEMVKNFVKGKIWMDAFIGTFIDENA